MATEPEQVQCPVRADFDPLDPVFLEDPYAVLASLPVTDLTVENAPLEEVMSELFSENKARRAATASEVGS